jgi:hypothetical protein
MASQKYCSYVYFCSHLQVLYSTSTAELMLNYIAYEMQCTGVLYTLLPSVLPDTVKFYQQHLYTDCT